MQLLIAHVGSQVALEVGFLSGAMPHPVATHICAEDIAEAFGRSADGTAKKQYMSS